MMEGHHPQILEVNQRGNASHLQMPTLLFGFCNCIPGKVNEDITRFVHGKKIL